MVPELVAGVSERDNEQKLIEKGREK